MPSVDRRAIHPIRKLVQRLESLERAGVAHLKRTAASAALSSSDQASPPEAAPMEPPADDRVAALAAVARRVAACTRCAELARSRTQTVFGVGNPHARLVFLGEAPGADEDRLGEPFVGRAGQLLTDIIVKGMKMRREDVYICNILRCRPPGIAPPCRSRPRPAAKYLDRPIGHHPAGVYMLSWGLRRAKSAPNQRSDRPTAGSISRFPGDQGPLHVSSRLCLAESPRQAAGLGRHPVAHGRNGDSGAVVAPTHPVPPTGRSPLASWVLAKLRPTLETRRIRALLVASKNRSGLIRKTP